MSDPWIEAEKRLIRDFREGFKRKLGGLFKANEPGEGVPFLIRDANGQVITAYPDEPQPDHIINK